MNSTFACTALIAIISVCACRVPDPTVSGSTQTTFRSGHSEWMPDTAPGVDVRSTDDAQLVELRLIVAEMPRDAATDVFGGADWNGRVYDAASAPDLGAFSKRDGEIEIVSRPRLVVRSGQTAEMSVSNVQPYLRDVVVGADGRFAPLIDTLTEGIWFEALARNTSDPAVVELESSITCKSIARPIPERTISGLDTVRLQRPVLDVRSAKHGAFLRVGQTVALSLDPAQVDSGRDARITVALVTVERPAR
jgi:hypothetical protein